MKRRDLLLDLGMAAVTPSLLMRPAQSAQEGNKESMTEMVNLLLCRAHTA